MQFVSHYPWYYVLLCLLTGFAYAAILYVKDAKTTSQSRLFIYSLASLRFLSVSTIALLLLAIVIKRLVNETEKPVMIVAQDNSSSIVSGKDSSGIKTAYLQSLKTLLHHLKEKYEVRSYQFDSEVKPSENFDFSGKETDLSNVFNDIENNYANKHIGAIILATDGIYNKGENPLYHIEKINAPIYAIALGDTTPMKDCWIQAVNHNQIAYLGNSFPVEVVINAIDLKGKTVTVSISHSGKLLKTASITINTNSFSHTLHDMLDANPSGMQKYTITLSTLTEDQNLQNNTQSFMIEVIDNREKVLILANAPHPDVAAIKQSIASVQTYEVEVALLSNFTKPLKPYSLVILHHIPVVPSRISNELNANHQSTFIIENVLSNNTLPAKYNDVEASVKKEFPLFSISTDLQQGIQRFPAVKCPFKSTSLPNGIHTLMYQKIGVVETDQPLLYFSENNGIKSAHFTGDGLWRWRMADFANHGHHVLFNELISKTVQYLSVKADKSFFRVFTKKIINENEPIEFTAELYNQSYELVTEPDISLILKDEKGKAYNYTFSKKQTMYHLSAGQFPAGEYSYEAIVKYGDKRYSKTGIIMVKEIRLEKMNTVANHNLLHQLAKQSGGKFVHSHQLPTLEKEILSNNTIKSITYSHKQLTDLVNLKWLFYIILLLLSVEWFLRKRHGSI